MKDYKEDVYRTNLVTICVNAILSLTNLLKERNARLAQQCK